MLRLSKRKKEKRKMVTNNGVKYLKGRSRGPAVTFMFMLLISMVLFFGYSRFILAEDEFDFGNAFDGFDEDLGSDMGSNDTSFDVGTESEQEEPGNFDMSAAEISKLEVASEIKTQYFQDDPSDDQDHKDPFKPLIVKKMTHRVPVVTNEGQPVVQTVIPPLNLKLVGIIQAGDRKLCMITLDDKYLELFAEEEDPQGKFMVKEINEDSVQIVSYHRHGELRTLTLGGN